MKTLAAFLPGGRGEEACRRCGTSSPHPVDGYCDDCVQAVGLRLVSALAWDIDEQGPGWRDAARATASLLTRMNRPAQAAQVSAMLEGGGEGTDG